MQRQHVYRCLFSFVTRLFIDDEKIVIKNWLGVTKSIRWDTIKEVRNSDSDQWIKVFDSRNQHIKISRNFAGFELIGQIIQERSPKAALRKGRAT